MVTFNIRGFSTPRPDSLSLLRQSCSDWWQSLLPLLLVSVVLVLVLVIFVVGRFMVETLWMPLSELPLTFGAGENCPWCSFWWSSGGVDASLA